SSRLTNATLNADGSISVSLDARSNMLAGAIPSSALLTMVNSGLNDTQSSSAGIRFLSRAAEPDFMPSDSAAVSMVNEASQAAATVGVQNTALRLSDAASQNVLHHMSLGHYGNTHSVTDGLFDFWATPMYGNTYMSGMGGHSGQGVRGQYGGLALGMDAKVAEFCQGVMRDGVAFIGGGGKAESRGTVTDAENSYGFGGLNIYAAWQRERVNIIGSLGYGFGSHDVKMGLPSSMQMGRAKAELDTHAFTADLRAEYVIPTHYVDFLPHVGVRYTHLHTEGYDLKVNGAKINSVDSDNQDIVQFPVGLTMTKDFDWNDWTLKPYADVSYIPVVGDHKTKSKVRYSGIDAVDNTSARIMDDDSWAAMVGLVTEHENIAVGLNYTIQTSSHETDQGVNLTLGWKF
ncbi:MAG: autotransporter outer membrane beta-barrel domain-containing protein, partial [Mailhella sp.]|nr:autotransporter outer membrane beta-barrel domain-containing protein [Mailhella sp.]